MELARSKLRNIFLTGRAVSKKELFDLFDLVDIPAETGWRTVLRLIFDSSLDFPPSLQHSITKQNVKPVMLKALDIIEKKDYSEKAFVELIRQYNTTWFGVCQNKIREMIYEIAHLTKEFKSTCINHQTGLEELEGKTLDYFSSDIEPEQMVEFIKNDFKELIEVFKSDIDMLDHISHTDYLTGLQNRRFFDKQLKKEIMLALSEKTWLNLVLIDIDDFKLFNDKFGHLIGDQALKAVAFKIRTVSEDFAKQWGLIFYPSRYGGEEFAVILPGIDMEMANDLACKINTTIANYNFVIRNSKGLISRKNIMLTVSIGVAGFDHKKGIHGMEALISNADQAMYDAKKAGKNCVRMMT